MLDYQAQILPGYHEPLITVTVHSSQNWFELEPLDPCLCLKSSVCFTLADHLKKNIFIIPPPLPANCFEGGGGGRGAGGGVGEEGSYSLQIFILAQPISLKHGEHIGDNE